MSELKDRLKSPTPNWFKRIIRVGLILASAGAALLISPSMITDFVLPLKVKMAAQWMVVTGLVAAAVAKTARETQDIDTIEPRHTDFMNKMPSVILVLALTILLASCSKKVVPTETIDTTERTNTTVEYVPVKVPVYMPGDTVTIRDTIPCKELNYQKVAKSPKGFVTAKVDINNGSLNIDCKTDSLLREIEYLQKNSKTVTQKETIRLIKQPAKRYIPNWVWWLLAINVAYIGLRVINWKYKIGWRI